MHFTNVEEKTNGNLHAKYYRNKIKSQTRQK